MIADSRSDGHGRQAAEARCAMRASRQFRRRLRLGNMSLWAFVLMIAGWFVTALSISLGAPF